MTPIVDNLFTPPERHSTYGPTSEALMSRPAKLLMAVQVPLAMLMLMLTVLIARPVSATS